MRTRWLVGIVVAAHCVAVGAVMLIQGCGRTTGGAIGVSRPPEPTMPPSVAEAEAIPVAPAPAPVSLPLARSWPAETTTYVVVRGDTLSGIAARHGLTVAEVVALNNISDPGKIRAEQTLVLPGRIDLERPKSVRKTAGPKPIKAPLGATTYVVKAGDSLSVIAADHGIKTAALKEANGLTSDLIQIGQRLVIPGGMQKTRSRPNPRMAQRAVRPPPMPVIEEPEVPGVAELPELELDPGLEDELAERPAVEAPGAPAAGTPEIRVHVVEKGEDLYSVAMMWGVSVARIKELNSLTDSTLSVGQQLKIPISE